ncbi:glycine betaine ABC transporter substrate-binding protein [Actinomycetospora termitidis]|uniref:Glycine betaine ABC transporter substrate-binding protein n=1 Tax=Actinomycetospora termitidis TaxID=3053470 RepID=A0ABT7ME22_9PSEU|nr:glycine betaine ABC transporter substrate-binding protein [Actinomycetospora sp. Odt1-22]MDL5158915.1 glycine betaine ABC transporter substrate-binding protein [Actinomycetospora sp. Odt1-22]
MSSSDAPQGRPLSRRSAVAILGGLATLALAGCSAPTPSSPAGASGPVRADVPGPAEISAATAGDTLPAGAPGAGTPTVTLGTKDFSEQFLLGELYAQALRAKGFTISLAQNVGGTEVIDSAFGAGRIGCYPEYVGEIASSLAGASPTDDALTTYRRAAEYEATRRNATLLKICRFQNTDVIVVRRELAERHGLRSVPDLAQLGAARLAAQPPFRTRTSGLAGMRAVYGLTDLEFFAVAPDETYGALDAGEAEVADGFSTDPELASPAYVELDDPQNLFGFQYVAPVVTRAVLAASGPAFARTCNWLSARLSVRAVREMNRLVRLDGQDEATVARDFLVRSGLR